MSYRPEHRAILLGLSAVIAAAVLVVLGLPDQHPPADEPGDPGTPGAGHQGYPIHYSIGSFDGRFGVTPKRFLELIREAKTVWEKPAGFELFRFDPTAAFRISLVFDERQQRRIEERGVRAKIGVTGRSFDNLKEEYDSKFIVRKEEESSYASDVSTYNVNVEEHNRKVAYWKGKGGAPPGDFSELAAEDSGLAHLRERLDQERAKLNEVDSDLASLGDGINRLVAQYNLQVENYNGRFVAVREFEKGVYNGGGINIYEFDQESDLRATIVHELGHALGLGHAGDPLSIMYYKLEKQDILNLRLTDKDVQTLRDNISGRSSHEGKPGAN